ncbi:MAG: fasciclin domain-containing protein [Caulobacteraceae bacterium]|nr:fasciclin domain-containing protein [Caulobacteraceae bacterium]
MALAGCDRKAETKAGSGEVLAPVTGPATADPMVGGAPMSPRATVMENASKAANLTTLVSAIQTAGLADTLGATGPFTVFAPDNAAFEKVPAETRQRLATPAGKADLIKLLTYHVVPGRLTAADLSARADTTTGKIELTTVEGEPLIAQVSPDGSITLTDAKGGTSKVTQADVGQSNGVIHVIDTVAMPK